MWLLPALELDRTPAYRSLDRLRRYLTKRGRNGGSCDTPAHPKPPAAVLIGDHNPFHAQRRLATFGMFHARESGAPVLGRSYDRRCHRYLWCNSDCSHCLFPPFLRLDIPWGGVARGECRRWINMSRLTRAVCRQRRSRSQTRSRARRHACEQKRCKGLRRVRSNPS